MATIHLPIFRDRFLFFQGRSAFAEFARPIELDAAHRRFFALALMGGMDVAEIIQGMPPGVLPDGETWLDDVLDRLRREDSFIEPVGWDGSLRFDAIAVDLDAEGGHLIDPLALAFEAAAPQARILVVAGGKLKDPPPGVHVLEFIEKRSGPIGSRFRFIQFARSLIAACEPTRLFMAGVHQALYMIGALERHQVGLGVRTALTPFVEAGPAFAARGRPSPAIVYSELLYWLRAMDKEAILADVMLETTAAAVAGWMILPGVERLFVPRGDEDLLLGPKDERQFRDKRIEAYEPAPIRAFLYDESTGAADGRAAAERVARVSSDPLAPMSEARER